jgi:two-component system cell cycle response regulator DivK
MAADPASCICGWKMPRNLVLLVDHDADSRVVYRTMLEHAGFEVLEAAHGAQGVNLARSNLPDVVVMALEMPILDGYRALEELKKHATTSGAPVIALTSLAWEADRERALAAGFCECLVKPCEPVQLLEAVRAQLARGA